MDLTSLGDLVAADLRRSLTDRASSLTDVYAVCLYVDDVEGDLLVSVATEAWFAQQRALPAYAASPEEDVCGPDGLRWSVGDWLRLPDDAFLSEATERALEPLRAALVDDDLDDDQIEQAGADWRALGLTALRRADPLAVLGAGEGAIAFVAHPDLDADEQREVMAATVAADRLDALFGPA